MAMKKSLFLLLLLPLFPPLLPSFPFHPTSFCNLFPSPLPIPQCTKALVWLRDTMSAALEVSVLVTLLTVSVIRTVVFEETAVVTSVSLALMVRDMGVHT